MQMGISGEIHFLILPLRIDDTSKIQEILSISPKEEISIQIFDADLIAGYEHITLAVHLAVRAWSENRNIARTLAMEALLYASAKRQIKDAIRTIGPSSSSKGCVILVLSKSREDLFSALSILKHYGTEEELIHLSPKKIPKIVKTFKIGERELSISRYLHPDEGSAIQSLVLERVALSDLNR
ncbi:MAG: KEOPS complex subunit Cgi121 [Candidatus Methanomethylicaceae archaeon]